MGPLQYLIDSLTKPVKAVLQKDPSPAQIEPQGDCLYPILVEGDEVDEAQRALRESKVEFWMAEIKSKEKEKASQLPLFFRFALKLREATEGQRLDAELRQELSFFVAQVDEEEREREARLDPLVLEREAQERRERELLRQEQERAYLESLATDQAKEAALQAREKQAMEEQERAARLVQSVSQRSRLTPEPPSGDNVSCLVVRFPDGSRVRRKLHKENRLQDLWDFVEYSRMDFSGPTPRELFSSCYTMYVLGAPPQALTDFSLSLEQSGLFPHPTVISVLEQPP